MFNLLNKIVCEIINCAKLIIINNLISKFQLNSWSTQQISSSFSNITAVSFYVNFVRMANLVDLADKQATSSSEINKSDFLYFTNIKPILDFASLTRENCLKLSVKRRQSLLNATIYLWNQMKKSVVSLINLLFTFFLRFESTNAMSSLSLSILAYCHEKIYLRTYSRAEVEHKILEYKQRIKNIQNIVIAITGSSVILPYLNLMEKFFIRQM